jgi:hypothetical protein
MKEVRGAAEIDRDFDESPRLSERQAVEAVIAYARDQGRSLSRDNYSAQQYYDEWRDEGLYLWWRIKLNGADWHYVAPDGVVDESAGATIRNQSSVKVCDGKANDQAYKHCPNNPTVINTSGVYVSPFSYDAKYQVPYDTVSKVEQMWEVTTSGANCCNVGPNNSANGGNIDINVGRTMSGGSYRVDGNEATILLSDTAATDPQYTAHEMGHAGHALFSPATFFLVVTSQPNPTKREHDAIIEYVGGMNEIAYKNYNPNSTPIFDDPGSWTTIGEDYSSSIHYDGMDMTSDELIAQYDNAAVGGHAVYLLAQVVGEEEAFRALFRGVARLTDSNLNGALSWMEVRKAMLKYYEDNSISTMIWAIKNAWYAVGVGNDFVGQQNPPTDFDYGAPQPPDPVTATLVDDCDVYGNTLHNVHASSTGATSYKLWKSTNNINYSWFWDTQSTTTQTWNSATVKVKASACNANGCSAMSSDDEELLFWCY